MLTVDLPADLESKLNVLAKQFGKTQADFIQEAVIEYLNDLEDLMIAEQRLRDVQSGKSQTYTLEEVERELGLAD